MAYSSDGKLVATGAADKTIKLWDAASGRELKTFAGHAGAVLAVAFSPDGKLLASARATRVCGCGMSRMEKNFGYSTGHTNVVFTVAFAPDGKNTRLRWL